MKPVGGNLGLTGLLRYVILGTTELKLHFIQQILRVECFCIRVVGGGGYVFAWIVVSCVLEQNSMTRGAVGEEAVSQK